MGSVEALLNSDSPEATLHLERRIRLRTLTDSMYWDSMSPLQGYYGWDEGNTGVIKSLLSENYTRPDPQSGEYYTPEEVLAAWAIVARRRPADTSPRRRYTHPIIAENPTSWRDKIA
jgi:hypothetical protein